MGNGAGSPHRPQQPCLPPSLPISCSGLRLPCPFHWASGHELQQGPSTSSQLPDPAGPGDSSAAAAAHQAPRAGRPPARRASADSAQAPRGGQEPSRSGPRGPLPGAGPAAPAPPRLLPHPVPAAPAPQAPRRHPQWGAGPPGQPGLVPQHRPWDRLQDRRNVLGPTPPAAARADGSLQVRVPAPPELSSWQGQGKVPASGCGAGGGCCPARPCAEPPNTAPGSPAHRGASPGRQRCGHRAWCLLGPGPGPGAPRQQTGRVQGQHGRKCRGGGQLSPVPHSQQTWQRPGPAGHAQISSYRAGGTPVQHTPWRTWGSPTQSPAARTAVPGLLSGSRMRHPLAPTAATLPTLPAAGSQRGPDTAAMSCATSSGISPLASCQTSMARRTAWLTGLRDSGVTAPQLLTAPASSLHGGAPAEPRRLCLARALWGLSQSQPPAPRTHQAPGAASWA